MKGCVSGFAGLVFGAALLCLMPAAKAIELADSELANPDVIAAGKKRFNRSCFYCHGFEGEGGKGASLQRRPDLTPEIIFNTISNGRVRGSSVMPPWKNTLSEEEITQLVAYIISLRDMPERK
ncbi:MAG: c-type cytochrome [Burkholderiales bacterium]